MKGGRESISQGLGGGYDVEGEGELDGVDSTTCAYICRYGPWGQ